MGNRLRKTIRIILIVLGALVVLGGGWFAYIELRPLRDFSATPLPDIKASTDPKVIARGEYVVNALAHCTVCHGNGTYTSEHQVPPDLKDLRGGYVIKAGPFGTFYPVNLTTDPATGIGTMSDGELARAIRSGVARDGRLAPLMTFAVGPMSDEDLLGVVSYLRTVPPIANPVPRDEWGFLAKALAGRFGTSRDVAPPYVAGGPGEISVARGEYLAKGPADCFGCHTPRDPANGFVATGPLFSGAGAPDPDRDPAFEIMAPNLTPDPDTGALTSYTEDAFLDRLKKAGRSVAWSIMPWEAFRLMTDEDLRSIFRYLRTLPPTRHVTGPTRRPKGWKPPS